MPGKPRFSGFFCYVDTAEFVYGIYAESPVQIAENMYKVFKSCVIQRNRKKNA